MSLVHACFFLSGLVALVYQTAWTREFAFVFGTSELAVVTVLAAYMAGLGAGAAIAGRLAPRVRRPVWVYAVLELAIGISALGVPAALVATRHLYVGLLGALDVTGAAGLTSTLFYLACSFAILMVPTALMGATLPLLARYAVRTETELATRVGQLYAVNTLGAVLGTVGAGFVLLPSLGLERTVWVAVALNAVIFALAATASRSAPPTREEAPAAPRRSGVGWVLPLIAGSGAISFSYEVLWTRLLSHLLGGSVYAFATMLASFLTGIAVGAAIGARLAKDRPRAVLGLVLAETGAAGFAWLAFVGLDALPALSHLFSGGMGGRLVSDALCAALVLLPSTLCVGATFPFAVRLAARDAADAGPATARVYAFNTFGAILGAVGAGLWLLPLVGFAGTLRACAVGNLLIAAIAAGRLQRHRLPWSAGLGLLALGLLLGPLEEPWTLLRSAPITRDVGRGEVTYFSVGRSATVLLLESRGTWELRTNGLPESKITRPGAMPDHARTARWLGALPGLVRPEATRMLVVGLGGGLVLEAVPPSFESVDVVELEPRVVRANQAIGPLRGSDPLRDPRVRILENDARSALLLARARWDAIVSQPSHPWTAGASHLYTREFFTLVRERLSDDGVFVQWMGPSFVDRELLAILVATLEDVFGDVHVFQAGSGQGFLMLASRRPIALLPDAARAIARDPGTYAALGIEAEEVMAAALLLGPDEVRRFARGADMNTDRRNLLQTRSPALVRGSRRALDLEGIAVESGFARDRPGRPWVLLHALLRLRFFGLARAHAAAMDPDDRRAADAWVDLAEGNRGRALLEGRRALEAAPRHPHARGLVSLIEGSAGLRARPLPPGGDRAERTVLRGLEFSEAGDWGALRRLDGDLAGIESLGPFGRQALGLRVFWRLHDDEGDRTLELADRLVLASPGPHSRLQRARAALVAGDTVALLYSLEGIGSRRFAREALQVLRSSEEPAQPALRAWYRDLEGRLARSTQPGRSGPRALRRR